MISYTVGFLFSTDADPRVVLIKKTHPDWQAGKLNGIGGKMAMTESPLECMIREFKEEAGVEIKNWEHFATITDKINFEVYFFRAFHPMYLLMECRTMTDEEIWTSCVSQLPHNVIENLKWLIPLALSKDNGIPLYIIERFKK